MGNGDFSARARVTADSGLPWPYVENAESAKLNPLAAGQSLLHGLEHGLDRHFGFGLGDPGAVDDFIDDVELNHVSLPSPENWPASSD